MKLPATMLIGGVRWSALAMLGVLVLAAVAACGGDDDSGGLGDADGTLRIAISGEPESIDPAVAAFAESAAIAKNTFATLLRFDPATSELHPYAATEVPTADNGGISEDGLTYTYHLNADAVWEDGTPLTADHFVYALQRLIDPRVGSYYGSTFYSASIAGGLDLAGAVDADEPTLDALRDAVGVKAVDDRTLEVTLAQPSPTFNLLMSLWPGAALRQDIVEAHGDIANATWTEAGNLVASGPFRLAGWTHGTSLVLERNPNFWLDEMTANVAGIEFSIIEDQNTAYAAYQAGDIDMAPVPLASLKSVAEREGDSGELRRVPEVSTFALVFNMAQPPFDSIDARRAFCRSIDRATAVSEIRQGNGNPTTAWLPPSLVPFFDDSRGAGLVFDVERAKADLNLAVSVTSAAPAGTAFEDVSLSYADTGANGTLAEFFQGQWQENLGIGVGLEGLDPPSFGETYFTGQFDIGYLGFTQDYHHPENWLLLWTSTGALNAGGYSSPEFDAAVDSALAEEDLDDAIGYWQRAEEILVDEDVALCPVFNGEFAWLVDSGVSGLVMTGADGVPGDFFYWQISVDS